MSLNSEEIEQALKSRARVFLSGRVHPGETPGMFSLLGIYQFLLSNDPRAALMRKMFVFTCIPFINPDGVARGHYRTNSLGLNLNRFYTKSTPTSHEGVHYICEYWRGKRLFFYLDAHGHASKRGCFIFGNNVATGSLSERCWSEQVWNVAFSHLCALNSPYFEQEGCNYQIKNMGAKNVDGLGKDGTGRVAIYNLTHCVHAYTLECNYNSLNEKKQDFKRIVGAK